MIADLLDFALARVGRGIAITPASVDLHAFVSLSVDELRIAFPEATLLHQRSGSGGAYLDAGIGRSRLLEIWWPTAWLMVI